MMNKKSILASLAILAVLTIGLGVAVAFLYAGVDKEDDHSSVDKSRYALLSAVPTDAVMVASFRDASDAVSDFIGKLAFEPAILGNEPMLVSFHYSGKLFPLYVFDMGNAQPSPSEHASKLIEFASAEGMTVEYVDCSAIEEVKGSLAKHSLVLASPSESAVKSSLRHIRKGISVADDKMFAEALEHLAGGNMLFISNAYSARLFPSLLDQKLYSRGAGRRMDFIENLSDWMAFDIVKAGGAGYQLQGLAVSDGGVSDFMSVIMDSGSGTPSVSDVIPSYTIFALSIPVDKDNSFVNAYHKYMDARGRLGGVKRSLDTLGRKAGLPSPQDWAKANGVEEVARAFFMVGSEISSVNLTKVADKADSTFSQPGRYSYSGYLASLYGQFFSMTDESFYTRVGKWIISGSKDAVTEYTSGRALEYSLDEYLSDVGMEGLTSPRQVSFVTYLSLTENQDRMGEYLSDVAVRAIREELDGISCCPLVLSASKEKKVMAMNLNMPMAEVTKTKAPEFERDTTVTVPDGPFRVKNSGTGLMNLFYQNENGYLCLKEENGKGLWGVPFKGIICGTAQTIDNYANGKLQILFGSGSRLYLIDRLGRFVNGFPVELGKEILIGPDVYDFSGARKYNVMVLHKDNTIQMYNLQGRKPDIWKGITSEHKIKGLPERILVGGKTFWVVRTSIQTLIYPFEGGEPLTVAEGDKMIRPDSKVTVVDAVSVEAMCYDGETRKMKLR